MKSKIELADRTSRGVPAKGNGLSYKTRPAAIRFPCGTKRVRRRVNEESEVFMDIRNEIKSYIVREGVTMTEVVERLAYEYGWSESVPNLSGKLRRGSLRYSEAVELADALGYDIVWQKRKR